MSWNLSVPSITLGDYRLATDNNTGAVVVQAVSAPPTQAPAPAVQPASIFMDASGISLVPSAEFGGRVLHLDLLDKLLDIEIMLPLGIMSVRSALGRLLARIAGSEAAVADISGSRLPAVANMIVNNESLDVARELAQALTDSAQSAAVAQAALEAATATSDIAAVSARVTSLEAAPGFDSTALEARVTAAETAIGGKADQSAVDSALADKASNFDLSQINDRLVVVEGSGAPIASRLDAVEAGVASKVAQADYDVYVAATDAAVAAAATAASTAQSAAEAAAVVAAAAEVKGFAHSLELYVQNTAGVSGAYWAETIGQTLATEMDLGKLVEYVFDAPSGEIVLAAGTPAAGALRRLRNGHAEAVLPVSLGGVSYEITAGEVMQWVFTDAWRLV